MTKRTKIQKKRLEQIESEFKPLLLVCLKACAQGRWGLFGHNDHLDPEGRYWRWPEATRLKLLSQEIKLLLSEVGGTSPLCEKFLSFCALRGSNTPGEPKLAVKFLAEIDKE